MIAHILPLLTVIVGFGVRAVPMPAPQGVTDLLSPGPPPDGCSISFPGVFSISIQPAASSAASDAAADSGAEIPGEQQTLTQIPDGQIQAAAIPVATSPEAPVPDVAAPVSEAATGSGAEGQANPTEIAANDFIPQTPEQLAAPATPPPPAGGVTQIDDGQIQAPSAVGAADDIGMSSAGSAESEGTASTSPAEAANVSAENDSNVSAPETAIPVTQIADGQIQAADGTACACAAAAAPASAPAGPTEPTEPSEAVTQIADGQVQAPQEFPILKVRQNGDPLQVTLDNGVLTDSLGRTGYIADNRQFQFDAPPQGGAIYTAGFSACPDGTLCLGGNNVFYACGSSDFSNLYDTAIYPDNCHEVKLLLG